MKDFNKLTSFISILNRFRLVRRTLLVNGEDRDENDVEHSYFLAMIAWYLVDSKKFKLDISKVITYALIHDLVEVYAGDVYFYGQSRKDKENKKQREHKAMLRLAKELKEFPDLHRAIRQYENQKDKESRFIYALDKLQPVLNIYLDNGRSWKRDGITLEMVIEEKADKTHISPELVQYFRKALKCISSKGTKVCSVEPGKYYKEKNFS